MSCADPCPCVAGSCCDLREHLCKPHNRGLNNKCYDDCMCTEGEFSSLLSSVQLASHLPVLTHSSGLWVKPGAKSAALSLSLPLTHNVTIFESSKTSCFGSGKSKARYLHTQQRKPQYINTSSVL